MTEWIPNKSGPPICPHCGVKTYLTSFRYMRHSRKKVKGRNRLIYRCPECGRYVNVHKGTNIAMGFPGDKELRLWRKFTHDIFDKIWRRSGNRKKAYTWLSRNLGIPIDECHIGMFTSEQCKATIELCIKELARVPDSLR